LLQRTPLYESHVADGAKMVDFGGWEMPLHYGSQVEEHHRVRRDAGMFDVSHMLAVDVDGPDATAFLRILLANDVARLGTGRALYSCMLNARGGIVDDLIACLLAPDRYRLVVNAATADKDLAWMREAAGSRDVRIAPRRDLAIIAVQGPRACEALTSARPRTAPAATALRPFHAAEPDGWVVSRTGYTGEDGFEIALPAEQAPGLWHELKAAGVTPCGLGARDTLRLEAGMNLYGADMTEDTTPLESGLAWTVALKDPARAFIGRAALEASAPQRALVGLRLLGRGVLRPHMRVLTPAGEGEITSGTFSPTLGFSIALARIPHADPAPDTLRVEVRGTLLEARVVRPPFVRHGRALVE
jgi:aminomethyltransferase